MKKSKKTDCNIPFDDELRRLMPKMDKRSDRRPHFSAFLRDYYVPKFKQGRYDASGQPEAYTEDERQVEAMGKIQALQKEGFSSQGAAVIERDFREWWQKHLKQVRSASGRVGGAASVATRETKKIPRDKQKAGFDKNKACLS